MTLSWCGGMVLECDREAKWWTEMIEAIRAGDEGGKCGLFVGADTSDYRSHCIHSLTTSSTAAAVCCLAVCCLLVSIVATGVSGERISTPCLPVSVCPSITTRVTICRSVDHCHCYHQYSHPPLSVCLANDLLPVNCCP